MRLIIFHLYTDLINWLRPPAAAARCRERRSARQTTTHIWYVWHTCRQALLAQADRCAVHAPPSNTCDPHLWILAKWWTSRGGLRVWMETQEQTPEDGLQSRWRGEGREPCPKRSEWSSYQMLMRLFSCWKSDRTRWTGGAECAEGVPPCENIMKLDSDKWFRSRLSAGQRLVFFFFFLPTVNAPLTSCQRCCEYPAEYSVQIMSLVFSFFFFLLDCHLERLSDYLHKLCQELWPSPISCSKISSILKQM